MQMDDMNDDVKLTTGCLVYGAIALVFLAASVLVGRFFGFAIGLAALLVLVATFLFWLACAYYKTNKDA